MRLLHDLGDPLATLDLLAGCFVEIGCELRKRRQLTQAQVAARLGLSQNRVSHLELHPEELSLKQLLGWCSVVGLELRLGERDGVEVSAPVEW